MGLPGLSNPYNRPAGLKGNPAPPRPDRLTPAVQRVSLNDTHLLFAQSRASPCKSHPPGRFVMYVRKVLVLAWLAAPLAFVSAQPPAKDAPPSKDAAPA